MPHVLVREDSNLVVKCEFCHLTPVEAVAVLRQRLEARRATQACGGCRQRMADEVTTQLARRRPA